MPKFDEYLYHSFLKAISNVIARKNVQNWGRYTYINNQYKFRTDLTEFKAFDINN